MKIPSTHSPVPPRAVVVSLLALAAAVVGNVVLAGAPGSPELLLWLLAVVPAFLLAYYRGWKGASLALAVGMAAVVGTELVLTAGDRTTIDPLLLTAVIAAFVGAALGAGWLADALHRARMLAERSSRELVALLAADGRLRYVSPAVQEVLGGAPARLAGRPVQRLVHVADRQRVERALAWLTGEHDRSRHLDVRVRSARGGCRILSVVGRNLLDDPTIAGIVVSARDVTRRRRLERHLRDTQKMEELGNVTGGIAHDFNNLLAVILSSADVLAHDLPGAPPAVDRAIRDIQHAARRGSELAKRLLAFSRRGALEPRIVDLGAKLEDLEPFLQRLLTPRIEVRTRVPDRLPPVHADPTALERIVLNLATNARDAIDGSGRLAIGAAPATLTADDQGEQPWIVPGEYVRMRVEDTGAGMDADTLGRVFEPLFTTKEPEEGTGLGLAVVYGLVKQHGGMIRVFSEPDEGTVFSLYFPAVGTRERAAEAGGGGAEAGQRAAGAAERAAEAASDAGAPPAARTADASGRPLPRGSETVLVIEDEEALLDSAARILERLGYRALTADSGPEALELYRDRAGRIDLVLSDQVMPEMSGTEVIEALREQSADARFLLMSGDPAGTEAAADGGPGAGPLPFLQKPWSVEDLARAVRATLDAPEPAG